MTNHEHEIWRDTDQTVSMAVVAAGCFAVVLLIAGVAWFLK